MTRRLRLVVTMALEPVDWKDLAIAEIRVFGRPAKAPVVDPERIAWDQPGSYPLKAAIADLCAGKSRRELEANRCGDLTSQFTNGWNQPEPVELSELAKGRFTYSFVKINTRHTLEFQSIADGRWKVMRHSMRYAKSGKPASPSSETLFAPDDKAMNECWEKLGKTRPDYPVDPTKLIFPDDDTDNPDDDVPGQAEPE